MKNTIYVCRTNNFIADELYKYGTITPHLHDEDQRPRRKKMSDETKFRIRSEQQHNSRRNQCSVCHTAKSKSGACMCD